MTPDNRPHCMACGLILIRYHLAGTDVPTADGEPSAFGTRGDNLVCNDHCGRMLAVRLAQAVGKADLERLLTKPAERRKRSSRRYRPDDAQRKEIQQTYLGWKTEVDEAASASADGSSTGIVDLRRKDDSLRMCRGCHSNAKLLYYAINGVVFARQVPTMAGYGGGTRIYGAPTHTERWGLCQKCVPEALRSMIVKPFKKLA